MISLETLIYLWLHGRTAPHDSPIFALLLRNFSEAVIFQGVTNNFHITLMKFEVVASIRRLKWPYRNGVLVWTKNQVFLLKLRYNWFWRGFISCHLVKLRCVPSWQLWAYLTFGKWNRLLLFLILFNFIFLRKLSGHLNFLADRSTGIACTYGFRSIANY